MKNNNESIVRVLKFSISVFSILPIINFIGIANTSYALFTKDVDSKNCIKIRVANPLYAKPGFATDAITNLYKYDQTNLAYDETSDNNLRYIGKDPNNYVSFNNELWRIIGVMNNIEDGSGSKASRIKLIRNSVYSMNIAFDANENMYAGNNDYSKSSLKTILNENFLKTIESQSLRMIDSVVWNLGAIKFSQKAIAHYNAERGTNVENGQSIRWIGKIGLMYPSDYLYATSGNKDTDRYSCLNYNSDEKAYPDCYNYDYLFRENDCPWTISPSFPATSTAFFISSINGQVGYTYVTVTDVWNRSALPSLYLKPNVKITGGTGTQTDPYKLSL